MKQNIGFIGFGKMASAIINACKGHGFNIIGSEINTEIAKSASQRLNIEVLTDNKELVKNSEIIFFATMPNQVENVLSEIKDCVTPEKLIVSIAAGVTIKKIKNILTNANIIRIMPNTPALVKLGMFGICADNKTNSSDVDFIKNLLSNIGRCIEVEENQMDIVTAISGSGPAFFYQVIENMARAGEKLGLDYEKSLTLAAQTAMGSAQMIFNRGDIPVQTLIDNVATKGGCTFVGIQEMKSLKSDELFYNIIEKTTQKACELGK